MEINAKFHFFFLKKASCILQHRESKVSKVRIKVVNRSFECICKVIYYNAYFSINYLQKIDI